MVNFNISEYPAGLKLLLTDDEQAPLDAGTPNQDFADQLEQLEIEAAFAPNPIVDSGMAQACHSGLWLLHNFLDESHVISQDIETATGSFWHGIMHRREGDYSNAKYWFRRVGDHPIFDQLSAAARSIDSDWFSGSYDWDPFQFVDLCESAVRGRSESADSLRRVARREWELLFAFSYENAIGQD